MLRSVPNCKLLNRSKVYKSDCAAVVVFLSRAVVNPNCKTEPGSVQGGAGPVNKTESGRKGGSIFEPEGWWLCLFVHSWNGQYKNIFF